jgi:uncharacterized membrane protein YphA (DoxX/SURF4 family)
VNTALWIAQGLLAAAFATSGAMKLARSREQLLGRSPWMEDFSDSTLKFIGVCEVLGAIGLVLPPLLDIAPWLAPIAATGLTTMMALAALMHVRRNEPAGIVVTLVLGAIAVLRGAASDPSRSRTRGERARSSSRTRCETRDATCRRPA